MKTLNQIIEEPILELAKNLEFRPHNKELLEVWLEHHWLLLLSRIAYLLQTELSENIPKIAENVFSRHFSKNLYNPNDI